MITAKLLSACGTDRLIEEGSEHTERDRDRQTDRKREREAEIETEIERDRNRQTDRHIGRQRNRDRERHKERESGGTKTASNRDRQTEQCSMALSKKKT